MERYLEFRIDEQTTELKTEAFLKKNAGLTKRQISQAKFRPDGITRNGVRCRVTETIYPGDVIRVCLEEAGTASAHLENYNDGIRSKDLSDFHSNRASAPVSETSFSLNILYEDTDILAVDKPAGMVTHPTGMHYTDSLSNLVASYFREKNEQVCVRPVGRLDQETSGIVVFAQNQVAASRLQSVKSPCKIHKQYLAAVSVLIPLVKGQAQLLFIVQQEASAQRAKLLLQPFRLLRSGVVGNVARPPHHLFLAVAAAAHIGGAHGGVRRFGCSGGRGGTGARIAGLVLILCIAPAAGKQYGDQR